MITFSFALIEAMGTNCIRESKRTAKLTRELRIYYISFLKSKVCSPPYCCALLLDPRMNCPESVGSLGVSNRCKSFGLTSIERRKSQVV